MGIITLGEVQQNGTLHMEVLAKSGRLEYDLTVLFTAQGAAFVSPITYHGQIINFNRTDVMINILYTRDNEKPIQWCGCLVKTVLYKGKKYHMISCSKIGLEVNRRGSYRLYVGISGIATVDGFEGKMHVGVKDISATGFSFVAPKENLTKEGADVRLTFEVVKEDLRFDLSGRLVRKVDMDNGQIQYGCRMYVANKAVDNYIAKRQREQAAHLQNKLIEKNIDTIKKLS